MIGFYKHILDSKWKLTHVSKDHNFRETYGESVYRALEFKGKMMYGSSTLLIITFGDDEMEDIITFWGNE